MVYIEKEIARYIENASMIIPAPIDDVECRCINCGHPMRFPIVARKHDIMALETLIDNSEDYLRKSGYTTNLLSTILKQLAASLKEENKLHLKIVKED